MQKKRLKIVRFIANVSVWMSLFIYAYDVTGQTTYLDTIVITATMNTQQFSETGRDIQTIRSDYFKNLPIQNIDDVIRFIPGVEVQQRGPQGSQSDIVIRGGTFQQVLVVLDGVRINDPLTGHFNAYIPIHPEEIERIEVLKGSAAAIHGPDAVGGVVHIITKSFAGKIQSDKLIAGTSIGSYGMLNGNIYGAIKRNRTSITAGVTYNNAKGIEMRGTTGYFHNGNAVISLHHRFNDHWRAAIRAGMDQRDFSAQNFYTSFLSDTAKEKVKTEWLQAQLVGLRGKSTRTLQLSYKHLQDQYQFRPRASANQNETNQLFLQAYRSIPLKKAATLTIGEQMIFKKIISNDRGNHDHLHAGFYGILSNKIGRQIHINETFRVDWDEQYGWIVIPQFNMSWTPYLKNAATPSLLHFRLGIGRGIRDADFTERYNNYNKSLVTGGSIGNPNLIAERSWNYEMGVDLRPSSHIKISATAFQRNQTDLIDWVPTPYELMPRKVNLSPNGNYALASNLASVISRGVETDVEMGLKLGNGKTMKLMTGLLWLRSTAGDASPLSFYLSSHARFLWNGNMLLSLGKTSFSLGFVHKTRKALNASAINANITPSYFIANSRIFRKLNSSGSAIFVQADNIFNIEYSDLLGSVMPGRWLSMGLQWVFEKKIK